MANALENHRRRRAESEARSLAAARRSVNRGASMLRIWPLVAAGLTIIGFALGFLVGMGVAQ